MTDLYHKATQPMRERHEKCEIRMRDGSPGLHCPNSGAVEVYFDRATALRIMDAQNRVCEAGMYLQSALFHEQDEIEAISAHYKALAHLQQVLDEVGDAQSS